MRTQMVATERISDDYGAVPVKLRVGGSPMYRLVKVLGKGGFGQVFLGRRVSGGDDKLQSPKAKEVALKFQRRRLGCHIHITLNEWKVYDDLGDINGVPKVHYTGQVGDYNAMVMDILGCSLRDVWDFSGKCMPVEMVACIAVESLSILADIHSKGYVHGDIKPENFLLGKPSSTHEKKLFLVDFGLATKWKGTFNNQHVEYAQCPYRFRGTVQYASVHALLGRTLSRRDDLESLAYTLIFLLRGQLPWENLRGDEIEFRVAKKKMSTSPRELCCSCPLPFREFFETVISLKFDEEPNYFKLISIFDALVGHNPSMWPLQIDGAQKIREVHKNWSLFDGKDDEQPRKKVRTGLPASIWLSVFKTLKNPIRQRYFNNVTDDKLHQLVEEGYQQGLYISAVAFSSNSWIVVMDDATYFTDQVFELAPCIKHLWITEKWNEGYQISSLAGATNGRILIVMSKGTSLKCQRIEVSNKFPFEWIKKMWDERLVVTSMATADNCWIVVMSATPDFIEQVVELDFLYPRESIRKLWDKDYRITSAAATNDQIAIILSRKRWELGVEAQVVQRLSELSEEIIQEQRSKNRYLTCLCYGRTLT